MIFVPSYSSRRSLRNRQVGNWYRCNECHETWIDYEIHHPRRHGWYYRYLWSCRGCSHRWSPRRTRKIHTLQVSSVFLQFFIVSFLSHVTEEKNQWNHSPLEVCCFGANLTCRKANKRAGNTKFPVKRGKLHEISIKIWEKWWFN